MDDLPGYGYAIEQGYHLHSYASDRHLARYMKGGMELKIWYKGDSLYAELSTVIGMVVCTIPEFSFPHKHLSVFEKQLTDIMIAMKEDTDDGRG